MLPHRVFRPVYPHTRWWWCREKEVRTRCTNVLQPILDRKQPSRRHPDQHRRYSSSSTSAPPGGRRCRELLLSAAPSCRKYRECRGHRLPPPERTRGDLLPPRPHPSRSPGRPKVLRAPSRVEKSNISEVDVWRFEGLRREAVCRG